MQGPVIPFVMQQLLYQAPMLLVCLAGAVGGFAYMRRMPAAATTCIVGCLLFIVAALASAVAQGLFLRMQTGAAGISSGMTMVAVASGLVRAVGLAAIVASVFMGRDKPVAS